MNACLRFTDLSFSFFQGDFRVLECAERLALYDGDLTPHGSQILVEGNKQADWMSAFSGPFLLLLFCKQTKRLLITQHTFGSGINLFFCVKDQAVWIASSLKELKASTVAPFRLNASVLQRFFLDGFFPKGETLIESVHHLKAGCSLTISSEGIQEQRFSFSDLAAEYDLSPEEHYRQVMEDSIRDALNGFGKTGHMALSSGYDSNCILYYARKIGPERQFHTYSVGGVKGIDEATIAAQIAKCYDNVTMHTGFVTPNTLTHLDEITATLEGMVFERGIFLQYELAKLLHEQHAAQVLLGEGSDQIFREDTYTPDSPADYRDHYSVYGTPYEALAALIIPKSRLMINAFGIKAKYPYMNPNIIRFGYRIRAINGRHKAFHKAQVSQLLAPEVMGLISKKGGSTDLAPLFPEGFDCGAAAQSCRYYSRDYDPALVCQGMDYPADMDNMEEAMRKYYLQLKYLESFEKQFCDHS